MAFEWDNSYSVKVAVCDEQHMKLFDIMNELANAMRMGKGREAVDSTLNQLLEYTQTHFRDEEALLEKTNYPQLAAHQQMHRMFVSKVQSMQTLARSGKRTSAMQVLQLGREWLVNHIQKADKQYSAHLNAAGIR
ncbi:MAG TPA: bacteriohemerythrin [Acidobacteriaceae bacterium]|nr:bacteriohemerythrin [Acidobacteriaceae bacterium]